MSKLPEKLYAYVDGSLNVHIDSRDPKLARATTYVPEVKLKEAQAEIERLQKYSQSHHAKIAEMEVEVLRLKADLAAAKEENAALREALQFVSNGGATDGVAADLIQRFMAMVDWASATLGRYPQPVGAEEEGKDGHRR